MGSTRYYDLAFFDFGDELDSVLNVRKEIDRFVIIDKQIYGLYNVFGNGVIDGWVVEDSGYTVNNGISVSITAGIGIIKYMAGETSVPSKINFLPSNSSVDIYATIEGTTVRTRGVSFFAATVATSTEFLVKLATVVTGTDNVLSIDNTVRDLINFRTIIEDEVNKHKHRGTPSKIDLKEETKNQLPGARIEGIDASDIISGKFNINRIPIIDHNDLENTGLLTHAALDSFVKTLSQNNVELLGEVASVNLLKTIIFLKYIYSEIDEHAVNELAIIPGISPNSYIDFEASTAYIDLEDRCISGYPAKIGRFTSVYWRDQYSFYNAYLKDKVIVSNGTVSLERSGINIDVIENFEVDSCNAPIDFKKEIVLINDHAQVISQCGDTDKIEGKYSGKFTADTDLRAIFTKNLKIVDSVTGQSIGRDWSTLYDELVLWVKTTSDDHEAVYFYIINGDYTADEQIKADDLLGPFTLLQEDHSTSNTDASMNNFEEVLIDLTELRAQNKNMDNITQFVIYTNEISNDFSFLVDNIHVRRTNLVSPSGTIRLRYLTEANITFHSIFYTASTPSGTNISVRVKVASSEDLLSRTAYSASLSSGQIFAIEGTSTEIEIILTTVDETVSPVLSFVELRMLVDANFTGFNINSKSEWNEGILKNLLVQDTNIIDDADIIIKDPINIDGYFFAKGDSISENISDNSALLGFSGAYMPVSPKQAINWDNNPYRQFNTVSSVIRKFEKNFLIADTLNNRVLEVNSVGSLIKGFGTTYMTDADFYPLSVVYNPSNYILSIVFTKGAYVKDITKIALYIGSSKLSLSSEDTILQNTKSINKVLEILLCEDNYTILASITENLFINFEDGAFTEDINTENSNTSKLYNLYGMECFIGDFTYVNYIKHPIFIDILENRNWIVANSSIPYISDDDITSDKEEDMTVADVVEFNPDNQEIVFSTDYIKFSDFSLGSICEYETGKFIVAGILSGNTVTGGVTGTDLLIPYNDDNPAPAKVKFRASALDSLNNYRGNIVTIDKINNRYQVFYTSPDGLYCSDVNMYKDGRILVSESSFGDASGRLIILDSYGNITWSQGVGTFNIISDAKILNDDHIMISV